MIEQNLSTQTASDFWSELFLETDIDVPILLRRILDFNGYDSKALLVSVMNDSIFQKIEEFMRTSYDLIDKEDIPAYFGIFKNKPEKFQLLEGNIVSLTVASKYLVKIFFKGK